MFVLKNGCFAMDEDVKYHGRCETPRTMMSTASHSIIADCKTEQWNPKRSRGGLTVDSIKVSTSVPERKGADTAHCSLEHFPSSLPINTQ